MYVNDSDDTICLNADKSAVVDCSSVDAAWILVGPGGELDDATAAQYGLEQTANKARRPVEDKAVDPAEDKDAPAPSVPRRRST